MRIVGIVVVLAILAVLYIGTGGEAAVTGNETSTSTSSPANDAGFANFK